MLKATKGEWLCLIQNHDFPATTSKYLNFVVDLKRVDLKHAAAKFMSRSKVRSEKSIFEILSTGWNRYPHDSKFVGCVREEKDS